MVVYRVDECLERVIVMSLFAPAFAGKRCRHAKGNGRKTLMRRVSKYGHALFDALAGSLPGLETSKAPPKTDKWEVSPEAVQPKTSRPCSTGKRRGSVQACRARADANVRGSCYTWHGRARTRGDAT